MLYTNELKLALGCKWCGGRLNNAFETCQNCGGQNMDAKNNVSKTAGATDFQEHRNVKLNYQNIVLCTGGSGGAGGFGIVVGHGFTGCGGGAGTNVISSKK